jgi:type III restriction enzyme
MARVPGPTTRRTRYAAVRVHSSPMRLRPLMHLSRWSGFGTFENQGIIGEGVDLTLAHLEDMRDSTTLMPLTRRLLYTKYRDPDEEAKMHLFGQLKRVARQWLDGGYLKCSGGTYPAQIIYREIANMAAERIKAAITETLVGEPPVKAILDAYNPTGSTRFVNFTTSKENRWQTDTRRSHVNWIVCDSDWEAEFCRVAEAHPKVRAYVKNQNLGLEVPYLTGSTPRIDRDFLRQGGGRVM